MATREMADELAQSLSDTARLCGLNTRIAISDMNQPLGSAVGNALEVKEAIRVLKGERSRFSRLCIDMAGLTLEACGLQPNRQAGMETAADAISSGRAKEKAREWFKTQGATVDVIENPNALPLAPVQKTILNWGVAGWIARLDAAAIGTAVVELGGGRHTKTDLIDPSVGVELHVEVGSKVEPGQPLMTIHAASAASAESARDLIIKGVSVSPTEVRWQEALIEIL